MYENNFLKKIIICMDLHINRDFDNLTTNAILIVQFFLYPSGFSVNMLIY